MRDVSHALSRFPCVRLVSGVSFSCPLVGVLHFFYRVTPFVTISRHESSFTFLRSYTTLFYELP